MIFRQMIFYRFFRMHRFWFLRLTFSPFIVKVRRCILFLRRRPTINKKSSPETMFCFLTFCTSPMSWYNFNAEVHEIQKESWDCLIIDIFLSNEFHIQIFISIFEYMSWPCLASRVILMTANNFSAPHNNSRSNGFCQSRLVTLIYEGDIDDMSDARPPFSLIISR